MRLRIWAGLIVGVAMGLGLGTAMYGAEGSDDPYLWLEDIRGAKALDWVKDQNAVSLKLLKNDPDYQKDYDAILAIFNAIQPANLHRQRVGRVFARWRCGGSPARASRTARSP